MTNAISTKELLLKRDRTHEDDVLLAERFDELSQHEFEELKKELRDEENVPPDAFHVLERERVRRRLQHLP